MPRLKTLHEWLIAQRVKTADGCGLARAIDYGLKRWPALIRYLDQGNLPIDNNPVENSIRPITLGRRNWLSKCPDARITWQDVYRMKTTKSPNKLTLIMTTRRVQAELERGFTRHWLIALSAANFANATPIPQNHNQNITKTIEPKRTGCPI